MKRAQPTNIEQANALSEYWHALSKDCPGKTWFYADIERRAPVYRALRINPADPGATYAAAPFRLARIGDRPVILAAYPTPRLFGEPTPDWLDIEAVISWDPVDDTASVLGDDTPQLAGAFSDTADTLFASPRAFFQAWAMKRAQFAIQRQTATAKHWHVVPQEGGDAPGCLIIGRPQDIRWSVHSLPEHLTCHGVDPKEINRAIMRAARLPRAVAAPSDIRRAA